MPNHAIWINDADEQVIADEAAAIGIDAHSLLCVWIYQMLQAKQHGAKIRKGSASPEPKRKPGRPRTKKFDQDVLYIREKYERLKEAFPKEYADTWGEFEEIFETAVKNFDEQAIAEMLRQEPWKRK